MTKEFEKCECMNKMADAMMAFDVANELAEASARGEVPEWAKNQAALGNQRSVREELEDYQKLTEEMIEGCGLDLAHVYPFRGGDPIKAWKGYVERAKEIADRGGYDLYTFDMLNEALVVGSECKKG